MLKRKMNPKKLIIKSIVLSFIFLCYTQTCINGGIISNTIDVIYFFPKNGTENPSGNPNWYYYWSQTTATTGIHYYSTTTANYGYYNPGDTYFYIGAAASGTNSNTRHDGIDCFAETCIHENTHLTDWQSFWPGGYNSAQDLDGDRIPDSQEPSLGFDPTQFDTNPADAWPYDFAAYSEPRAYTAEHSWKKGNADSQDWSAPGHQY